MTDRSLPHGQALYVILHINDMFAIPQESSTFLLLSGEFECDSSLLEL